MAVTARTLRLVEDLRRQLDDVVDAQTRDLVRAWAVALDEVLPDLNAVLVELLTTSGDRITRAQMLRSQRLMRAVAVIADMLEGLAAAAGVRITGDLQAVIAMAGAAQASVIDSQLPPGSQLVTPDGWDRVDARQIEAIVTRSTQSIVSRLDPLPAEVMDVVRRELIRGVAAGSNPRETARRMVARVEGHVNGRWGLTRALSIARTETLDAHREAARVAREQEADVLSGWTWGCKLDGRSCPACFAMHGTFHEISDPGPEDHPQGRCAAIPRTKSWAELGFLDIEEPPDLMPNAADRFADLEPGEQRQVLGPRRFEAWVAGEYPMSQWAVKRENPDWRPSYQVSPAPPPSRTSQPGPVAGDGGFPDGGYDFGANLTLKFVDNNTKAVVAKARAAIGKVHGVNVQMPALPVLEFSEAMGPKGQRLGSYSFESLDPDAGPKGSFGRSVTISVNLLDTAKVGTLLHEMGHFLDHKGLGVDPSRFASAVDPILNEWRRAILSSDAFSRLQEMGTHDPETEGDWATWVNTETGAQRSWNPNREHVLYLLDPREMFARSYAQWIAERSGVPGLLDEVLADLAIHIPKAWESTSGSRPAGHPHQWTGEDFKPIGEALDRLFDSLNLLRGGSS